MLRFIGDRLLCVQFLCIHFFVETVELTSQQVVFNIPEPRFIPFEVHQSTASSTIASIDSISHSERYSY